MLRIAGYHLKMGGKNANLEGEIGQHKTLKIYCILAAEFWIGTIPSQLFNHVLAISYYSEMSKQVDTVALTSKPSLSQKYPRSQKLQATFEKSPNYGSEMMLEFEFV